MEYTGSGQTMPQTMTEQSLPPAKAGDAERQSAEEYVRYFCRSFGVPLCEDDKKIFAFQLEQRDAAARPHDAEFVTRPHHEACIEAATVHLKRRVAELIEERDTALVDCRKQLSAASNLAAALAASEAKLCVALRALLPFAECDAYQMTHMEPQDTYLWKAQNSMRETKGITMQHILDARAALRPAEEK